MNDIPYWSYRDRFLSLRDQLIAEVIDVFESNRLILGPRVEAFERAFASYCGCRHGVGVANGTDALAIAMKALGLKPGDEVITTSNTAVPTVAAIRLAGGRPVFVDIQPDTFLMDPSALDSARTSRTRGVIPVHLFGQMADLAVIQSWCDQNQCWMIEDAAQATGAEQHGVKSGSTGSAAAFSFYPTKVLGGFGDGGMVLTQDEALAARIRRLRFYGMETNFFSLEEGVNSRLDEVQAAWLHLQLKHLDLQIKRRRHIASRYDQALVELGDVRTPVLASGNSHVYYTYTIRTGHRDAVRRDLAAAGVGTQVNYPCPIHLQPGYAFLGYKCGDLPVTETASREMLSLPLYPELSDEDIDRVVQAITQSFSAHRSGP